MHREEIFDTEGHIRPIKQSYLDIQSDREKVNHYGRVYTRVLVNEAQRGVSDFELFIELHRRATKRHLTRDTRYDWDQKIENVRCKNSNAIFARDYDRKWQIFQKGGLTYMPAEGEALK
jgi:hypothetical protein